ncbi:hypothetical protein RCO48_26390 [Peribacillus frigoritolerans]|nr:hypothetical protein [Peribacillus frigoritolerans]
MNVIDKTLCIYLLLGGAGLMFVGSMFRAFFAPEKMTDFMFDQKTLD